MTTWRNWLTARGFPTVTPQRMANGVLRATLPPSAFRRPFALYQLGSFEPYRRSFMQLWCDDPGLRREAVLEQLLNATAGRRTMSTERTQEMAERLSARLEVPPPTPDEIRSEVKPD